MKTTLIAFCGALLLVAAGEADDAVPHITELPTGGKSDALIGKTLEQILPKESIIHIVNLDKREFSKSPKLAGIILTEYRKHPETILPTIYGEKIVAEPIGVNARPTITARLLVITKATVWEVDVFESNISPDNPVAMLLGQRESCMFRLPRKKSEQAGADQPATKPADKGPAKDQPSTPTSKDAPR